MKIPKSVKIGGKRYEVGRVKGLNNGVRLMYGDIDYNAAHIHIAAEYEDQTQQISLLHEIAHGIANHFDSDWGEDEKIVDEIARGMYMVIADNPEMFKR